MLPSERGSAAADALLLLRVVFLMRRICVGGNVTPSTLLYLLVVVAIAEPAVMVVKSMSHRVYKEPPVDAVEDNDATTVAASLLARLNIGIVDFKSARFPSSP